MRVNLIKLKLLSFLPKVEAGGSYALTFSRRSLSDASGAAAAAVGVVEAGAGAGAAAAAVAAEEETAEAKAPLMDLHGRRHNYLRISLTERCNLRCQYCMPAEGAALSARAALLTRAELSRLVRVFVGLGVDKVRLTGGEPTLRQDLADIIQELVECGVRAVGLTTNGLVLTRRLPALQRAGLTALNISLDSLRPERYERMARRQGLPRVLAAVDLALQLGFSPLKLNVVLMKGFNDDEICDFIELTRDRDIEVRFIEFMPFSGNAWDGSKLVGYRARRRHRAPVAARRPPRHRRLHRLHDAALLRHLQPAAAHRRRQPQGVPVRVGGGVAAGRGARGRGRRRAAAARARRARQEAAAARRYAEPRHYEEPAHGAHRRLAGGALERRTARRGAGARGYCSAAAGGGGGGGGAGDEQCGPFSHLDAQGHARMVDVGGKPVTARAAEAECALQVGARLLRLLRSAALPKGDALAVARVAGALAAKRAADLIPLCHPLPLDCVRVRIDLPPPGADTGGGRVHVACEVRVTARTGAEMEALTGCAVAALTLYDMCKSVDKDMRITDLRVVRKAGGRSGPYPPPPPPAPPARAPPAAAPPAADAAAAETYAPTNFGHF